MHAHPSNILIKVMEVHNNHQQEEQVQHQTMNHAHELHTNTAFSSIQAHAIYPAAAIIISMDVAGEV